MRSVKPTLTPMFNAGGPSSLMLLGPTKLCINMGLQGTVGGVFWFSDVPCFRLIASRSYLMLDMLASVEI